MQVLGIDIGGSGIKGAPVDLETGDLLATRYRIPTPESAKPRPMAEVVQKIVRRFDWQGPLGVGFPAVIRNGVVRSAANIHNKWIGTQLSDLLFETTGCPTYVINDADAAGLAEMTYGAGRDQQGVVLVVTVGTGLGTAVFTDGHLLPNTEFGHIEIDCIDAETRASDAARKQEKLSWKQWAMRLDEYLLSLERLLWPDLIILGGGVAKKHEKFFHYLSVEAQVLPAALLNEAGIVGAALAAHNRSQGSDKRRAKV
jgi:polyphosphate glucokinase